MVYSLFKTVVSFLILWIDLFLIVSRVLKSPSSIALLFIYPFNSFSIYFIYLDAPNLNTWIFTNVISSWWIDPFIIIAHLCLFWLFFLTVFCLYKDSFPCYLLYSYWLNIFSIPLLSVHVYSSNLIESFIGRISVNIFYFFCVDSSLLFQKLLFFN